MIEVLDSMPPKKRGRSGSPHRGSSAKKAAASPSSSVRPSPPSSYSPNNSGRDRDWKAWKRQKSHDYNTHQFLDASATVHAGLFGARRLPEIKTLWRQMVRAELNIADCANDATNKPSVRRAGESGGGEISSRHLRRRTNSHKRRRRYRFSCDNKVRDGDMSVNPKDNRNDVRNNEGGGSRQKNPCRRARRKPALLKSTHSKWMQPRTRAQLTTTSAEPSTPASRNWMPTHLWHAKRFHMSPPLFGWSIPLLNSNRGARASLRLASSATSPKCTIQDATWEVNGCSIKLEVKEAGEQSSIQTLLSVLHRICGDAPFLKDEIIAVGECSGGGIIHEIDAHPLQPIGPATFMFHRSSEDDIAHVSILVHPAIHRRVCSLLASVLSDGFDGKVTLSTVPLALLRVRGRASMETLIDVLQGPGNVDSLDNGASHGTLIRFVLPSSLRSAPSNAESRSSAPTILVKAHKPNEIYQQLPHNLACSGWDIMCHPTISNSLFQSFVKHGGACSIGLVEDARAQLEAYPPLAIFPRDYPDTDEGKSYWECGQDTTVVQSKGIGQIKRPGSIWKDWQVIRTCLEGSWGRINSPLKRSLRHWRKNEDLVKVSNKMEKSANLEQPSLQPVTNSNILFGRKVNSIQWTSLISPDNAKSTLVVRGSFGIPFLQLLNGCGRLTATLKSESTSTEKTRKRRPRRKVRSPAASVLASPLSGTESEAHSALCQQLVASLSLPAILRCEVYCKGKGTLDVGDLILPVTQSESSVTSDDAAAVVGDESYPLGVMVSGGFSPSRGKCHGIGFVGAARFIAALDGRGGGVGVPVPNSNGAKMMTLNVMIDRQAGRSREALLSILL